MHSDEDERMILVSYVIIDCVIFHMYIGCVQHRFGAYLILTSLSLLHGVCSGNLVCLPDANFGAALPYLPVPAFLSVSFGTQSSTFALPFMNFKS